MKKILFSAFMMLALFMMGTVAFAADTHGYANIGPYYPDGPVVYTGNVYTAEYDSVGTGAFAAEKAGNGGFGPAFYNAEGRWVGTMEAEPLAGNTGLHLSWEAHSVYDKATGGSIETVGTKMDGGYYSIAVYKGWTNAVKPSATDVVVDNTKATPGQSKNVAGPSTTDLDYSGGYMPAGLNGTGAGIVAHTKVNAPTTTTDLNFAFDPNENYAIVYKAVDASNNVSTEYVAYYLATRADSQVSYNGVIHTASQTGHKSLGYGNNPTTVAVMDRAWKGQTTHGNYQYNTNSCAGCHKFHQGQGDMLLFASTETALCESCHDGTVGSSNISLADQNAGVFPDTCTAGNGSSKHDIGGTTLTAAPGGNQSSVANGWGATLECSSCHNPHGPTGNPHINDQGFLLRFDNSGISDNGLNFSENTGKVISLNGPTLADQATGLFAPVALSGGVTTSQYVFKVSTGVATPYIWVNNKVGYLQVTPTISGTPSTGSIDAKFMGLTGVSGTTVSGLTIDFNVRPYFNTATKQTDNGSYWNNADTNYVAGSGQSLTLFCVQCHTDYLSGTRKDASGQYSTAMRHKTISDSLSCTRCHFAHGTSEDAMRDSAGYSATDIVAYNTSHVGNEYQDGSGNKITDLADAKTYIRDTGIDPANKRFTGFSVCLQCHADSALGTGATKVQTNNPAIDTGATSHLVSVPY